METEREDSEERNVMDEERKKERKRE